MDGAKIMKHYTNKTTLQVYGYDNDEAAKQYNDDYRNLVLMSDELFQEYRKQPIGGKWTLKGWVIDQKELAKHKRLENEAQIKKHTEEMNIALLTDDTETAKFHAQKIKELRK